MRVTLDAAGRIILPKSLRDELGLEACDVHQIETLGETITLHPVKGQVQLRRKHGISVCCNSGHLSVKVVEKTTRRIRQERDICHLGN